MAFMAAMSGVCGLRGVQPFTPHKNKRLFEPAVSLNGYGICIKRPLLVAYDGASFVCANQCISNLPRRGQRKGQRTRSRPRLHLFADLPGRLRTLSVHLAKNLLTNHDDGAEYPDD